MGSVVFKRLTLAAASVTDLVSALGLDSDKLYTLRLSSSSAVYLGNSNAVVQATGVPFSTSNTFNVRSSDSVWAYAPTANTDLNMVAFEILPDAQGGVTSPVTVSW